MGRVCWARAWEAVTLCQISGAPARQSQGSWDVVTSSSVNELNFNGQLSDRLDGEAQ